jgi:hypothetical protein
VSSSRVRLSDARYRRCTSKEALATQLLLDGYHPLEVAVVVNVSAEFVLNLERMLAKHEAQAAHERAWTHGVNVDA